MNKKLLLPLIFLTTLASCGNVSSSGGSSGASISQTPAIESVEIYSDSTTKSVDSFQIKNIKYTCDKVDYEYRFKMSLTFSCGSGSASYLGFEKSSAKTLNEITDTVYSTEVTGFFMSKSDFDKVFGDNYESRPTSYTYDFVANIPTDIKDEKYVISFIVNDRPVNIHLYATPEDKKQTWTITYKVSSKTVKTIEVKDNERIKERYIYESPDHLTYVYHDSWYKDSSFRERWDNNTQVRSSMILYGAISQNWDFDNQPTPELYEKIRAINHIPSDHVLVVPQTYKNRELVIMENVIIKYEGIEKIYIPRTVHAIYGGNFKLPNTPTVYYEGTETEWRSLFVDQSDIYLTNIVYNTRSPF